MASDRELELRSVAAVRMRVEVERDGFEVQLRWAIEEAALWKKRCYEAWGRENKLIDEIVRLTSEHQNRQ